MMRLQQLLPEHSLPAQVAGLAISGLQLDSRRLQPGEVFVAVPGVASDGRHFISQAISAGAAVVLADAETFSVDLQQPVPCVNLPGLAGQVGDLAARWFGEPANRLRITGVTGTNGKTSITWFLRDALNALGHACGLIGTLGVGLKGQEGSTGHTTPDPITLQKALLDLCDAGADSVAMEVSSHALDQHRLGSTPVRIAVFSNLSRDHLDYHGDMDTYLLAKVALFTRPELQEAVINSDDASAPVLLGRLNDGVRCITYGAQAGATVRCVAWQPHPDGMDVRLTVGGEALNVTLPLFGAFNLSNLMAVAGVLHGSGVEPHALATALAAVTPVPGRMEPVREAGKPTVIVDYAHTPDGLEKALAAAREHFPGRLHCVVGCGGDRDTGKRPLMAAAAERGADRVLFTSDNPRGERPDAIIEQMRDGLADPDAALVETDRRRAVALAVSKAGADDVVLVAGKGHEDYQEVAGQRHPMDDRDLARQALAAWQAPAPAGGAA